MSRRIKGSRSDRIRTILEEAHASGKKLMARDIVALDPKEPKMKRAEASATLQDLLKAGIVRASKAPTLRTAGKRGAARPLYYELVPDRKVFRQNSAEELARLEAMRVAASLSLAEVVGRWPATGGCNADY